MTIRSCLYFLSFHVFRTIWAVSLCSLSISRQRPAMIADKTRLQLSSFSSSALDVKRLMTSSSVHLDLLWHAIGLTPLCPPSSIDCSTAAISYIIRTYARFSRPLQQNANNWQPISYWNTSPGPCRSTASTDHSLHSSIHPPSRLHNHFVSATYPVHTHYDTSCEFWHHLSVRQSLFFAAAA